MVEKEKEKISEEEANREISKFHKALLEQVIKVIKVNQDGVRVVMNAGTERAKKLKDFYLGSISFGDVLIHQIGLDIKRINKEMRK